MTDYYVTTAENPARPGLRTVLRRDGTPLGSPRPTTARTRAAPAPLPVDADDGGDEGDPLKRPHLTPARVDAEIAAFRAHVAQITGKAQRAHDRQRRAAEAQQRRPKLPFDAVTPPVSELRRRREALGLSQRDLAAAAGASRGAVAAVESTGPSPRSLTGTRIKVAQTLARLEGERAR